MSSHVVIMAGVMSRSVMVLSTAQDSMRSSIADDVGMERPEKGDRVAVASGFQGVKIRRSWPWRGVGTGGLGLSWENRIQWDQRSRGS